MGRDSVQACFLSVRERFRAIRRRLGGSCVEASAAMVDCLRDRGVRARLVKRFTAGRYGHWTVGLPGGREVDPTIGFWHQRPAGVARGKLYEVPRRGGPHAEWRKDSEADEPLCRLRAREAGVL